MVQRLTDESLHSTIPFGHPSPGIRENHRDGVETVHKEPKAVQPPGGCGQGSPMCVATRVDVQANQGEQGEGRRSYRSVCSLGLQMSRRQHDKADDHQQ